METDRLYFIACRDGVGAAMDFAKQTLHQYETALVTPKHFSQLPQYVDGFRHSVETFKRFLNGEVMI